MEFKSTYPEIAVIEQTDQWENATITDQRFDSNYSWVSTVIIHDITYLSCERSPLFAYYISMLFYLEQLSWFRTSL